MGFNTTILVLNDRLSEIENDPKLGKKLVAAIRAFNPYTPKQTPYITGQTQVIGQHHSAALCAYVIGGNTGKYFGYCGDSKDFDNNDKLINNLACHWQSDLLGKRERKK